jgi:hypothetical protein
MKKFVSILAIVTLVVSCNNKEDKKDDATTTTTSTDSKLQEEAKDPVLSMDVTTLKDEAGFLKAWEDFTSARMADEKKQEADKSYPGHYVEYTNLYTKLLKATTAFAQTIQPASAAVAFNEKVSAIQKKMYP